MPIRHDRTSADDGPELKALDAEMPLGADHETPRALWMLRLLVNASPRARLHATLDDGCVLEELGLVSEEIGKLSPWQLRRWLEHRLQQLEARELEGSELVQDSISQNAHWLAEWLGLSEAERKVLAFAATVEASEALATCLGPFKRLSNGRVIQLLAGVLGESVEDVRGSLSTRSALVRAGVLQFRPGGGARHDFWIGLEHPFDAVFTAHYERSEELFSTVCPQASEPELGLDAFLHLARDLALLTSLLRGANLERLPGINVLVHGPPGSGKSQKPRQPARSGLPATLFFRAGGFRAAASGPRGPAGAVL